MSSPIRRTVMHAAIALGLISSAALVVACGETAEQDPTPVKTWKITPAATQPGGAETPAPTEPSAESPTAPADGTPSTAATTLEIVAVSSVFDVTELEAPAGQIIIKLDNQDAGILHNIAVFQGDDASGELMGATDLESGPVQQELTLDLQPGEYYYQCDAHPTTMKGTLTVS